MSGFWATVWVILKYSALIGGSFALIALMILLFHPIYLSLKGRASIMGQRGEVKLSYLFGLLRLRYIATVHTQDVWLEIGWFKKLLQRESVVSDKVRAKKDADSEIKEEESLKEEGVKEEKAEVAIEEKSDEEIEKAEPEQVSQESVEQKSVEAVETQKAESAKTLEESVIEENKTEEKAELSAKTENIEETEEVVEEVSEITDEELAESINEEDMPKVEATPEQLAQLQSILEEEEKKEQEKKAQKSGWKAKLRKFKKDFNRRYEQLQGKFRLAKQKWNSLWPVVKRFWNRGKKGFRFHDAYLKVEYSLDEHYLTGMLCGYLAPTIGFVKSYGLDFEPVAMFPEKPGYGVYSKAAWYLDIKPYRLVWAVAGLLFEKNVYKKIYWLYKYKKEKKKNKK